MEESRESEDDAVRGGRQGYSTNLLLPDAKAHPTPNTIDMNHAQPSCR
jgi:hypothetical protein